MRTSKNTKIVLIICGVLAVLAIAVLWGRPLVLGDVDGTILAEIKAERETVQQRLKGEQGRPFAGDDRRLALLNALADGHFPLSEYEQMRRLLYLPYEVSSDEWEFFSKKAPSREAHASAMELTLRSYFATTMAEWLSAPGSKDSEIRDRFIADTLAEIEKSPDHRLALGQFTVLNVMGVLARDKVVRDRAVAGLQARTDDAAVQEAITAWVNAEKLVREQRSGSPAGR